MSGFDPQQPIARPIRRFASRGGAIAADSLLVDGAARLDGVVTAGRVELVIDFDSLGSLTESRAVQLAGLVAQLHGRGFVVHGLFTLGRDHDDAGCFERLVEWIEARRLATVELRLWTPDPHGALVRELAREDRIRHRSLECWDGAHVVVAPKQMSAQTLYRGWAWAQRRLDSLGSIWRRRPRDRAGLTRYLVTVVAAKLAPTRARLRASPPQSGVPGRWRELARVGAGPRS